MVLPTLGVRVQLLRSRVACAEPSNISNGSCACDPHAASLIGRSHAAIGFSARCSRLQITGIVLHNGYDANHKRLSPYLKTSCLRQMVVSSIDQMLRT
jgi:hypothetical protein